MRAVGALGELKDPEAAEPLIEAFTKSHRGVAFALSLVEIGDPRALEILIQALKRLAYCERLPLWEAAGRMSNEGYSLLLKVLDEDGGWSIEDGKYVARILGEIGDERAIEPLTKLFERANHMNELTGRWHYLPHAREAKEAIEKIKNRKKRK